MRSSRSIWRQPLDEDGRLDFIQRRLTDRFDDLIADDELIREYEVVYEDQLADEDARCEADFLGVTPDQYLWLAERLTDEEFGMLSDEDMHRLLAAEYSEYPASPSVGERTVTEPRSGLPDGCGFWLGTAAFFTALGTIGITIAVTEYHPPWPAAWFIAGSVMCAIGCAAAVWAQVLYLAHGEAKRHWCPDSRVHVPEAQQAESATQPQGAATAGPAAPLGAADAVSRSDLARWLRPVLREINGDLRQAAAGIEKACRERSYRDVRHEFNLSQTWEENRQRLAALEGGGDLYDTIRDAYAGIGACRTRLVPLKNVVHVTDIQPRDTGERQAR